MRVTTVNYSYCVTNCGVVDGGYRERKSGLLVYGFPVMVVVLLFKLLFL